MVSNGCFLVGTSSGVLVFCPFFPRYLAPEGWATFVLYSRRSHPLEEWHLRNGATEQIARCGRNPSDRGLGVGEWRMEGRWQGCFHTHTLPDKVFLVWYFDFFFLKHLFVAFVGHGCWNLRTASAWNICFSEWDEKTEKLLFSSTKKLGIRSGDKPLWRITTGLPGLLNVRSARNQLNSRCFF